MTQIERPTNPCSEHRRLRVVSDGVYTKLSDADTGEEIPLGMRIKFEHDCWDQSECRPRLEVDGQPCFRAEVDVMVEAQVWRYGNMSHAFPDGSDTPIPLDQDGKPVPPDHPALDGLWPAQFPCPVCGWQVHVEGDPQRVICSLCETLIPKEPIVRPRAKREEPECAPEESETAASTS